MEKLITKVELIIGLLVLVLSNLFFISVCDYLKNEKRKAIEAASIMSDIIKCYSDIDEEFDTFVENWFLDSVDATFEENNTEEVLNKYGFCY